VHVTSVLEHQLIGRLAAGLPRSPLQINGLHESDAELVRLPGSELVLAVTTDALAEELATGLYRDPWHIGWMLVMVNASDLAAVGAEPLGILLCESLPPDAAPEWLDALQRGITEAAVATGLAVLGGDTNASAAPHLAGTAIGLVRGPPFLTRRGCRPGDLLYASAPLGAGGAYACARLLRPAGAEFPFRPIARLAEGQMLRGRATACMDTSDGALATLDELMIRSGVGFRVDTPLEDWTDPQASAVAAAAGLPPWTLHAGPHGEFELVFTVPAYREAELLRAAAAIDWIPVRLGTAVPQAELTLSLDGAPRQIDTRRLRNLFTEVGGDPQRYLESLKAMANKE
jgi:thiamine-monophosphate kinase